MVVTIGTGMGLASTASAVAIMVMPVLDANSPTAIINPPAAIISETPSNEPEDLIVAPEITLVRVDQQGGAVIGGRAEPNIALRAFYGEDDILATRSEASGDFIMLADLPADPEPRELVVVAFNDDGTERARSNPVLILGREPEEAPTLIVTSDEGPEIVEASPSAGDVPQLPAALSLDTITYDEGGDVSVGGRGSLSGAVRIYLDNTPITTQPITENGDWKVSLPNVDTGLYTLRIDELNTEGEVTSRVESPFKKEIPDLQPGQITVQPGNTLWALAANTFGEGDRYVMIFEANKDLIRDPDLIYPGQIFQIPAQ